MVRYAAHLVKLAEGEAEGQLVPAQPKPKGKLLPALAGLGAAAVAAPLLYHHIRKPTWSSAPALRKMQQASGGNFARTVNEPVRIGWRGKLQRILYDADKLVDSSGTAPAKPAPFRGAVHHFDQGVGHEFLKGTANPKRNQAAADVIDQISDNKWREYQFFNQHAPGSMAPTENVADVLKRMGVKKPPTDPAAQKQLMQSLQGELKSRHPQGFLIKEVGGVQSAGKFPQEHHDLPKLLEQSQSQGYQARLRQLGKVQDAGKWEEGFKELRGQEGFEGRVLEGILQKPRQAIVQQKVDIEKPTGLRAMVGRLMGQPASKEVRVHVIQGQAVPSMAAPRFDPTMYVADRRKMRDAASYAQGVIDKLPRHMRGQDFNMDVAPLTGGGFKLIESNPGGNSGILHPGANPLMPFKLRKAMTGQWSKNVAGAGATAGSAVAGGAAYKATDVAQNRGPTAE